MWERSAIVGYTVAMNWRSSRRDGAAQFNKPAHYWFGGFMLMLGCVVKACCCGDVRRMVGKLRVLLVDSRKYILADRVCSIRCNLLQSWFPSDTLLLSHCRICSRSRRYYFPARIGPLYLLVMAQACQLLTSHRSLGMDPCLPALPHRPDAHERGFRDDDSQPRHDVWSPRRHAVAAG